MVQQVNGAIRSLPTGTVSDQAFSPDGTTLYTARNGTITVFNVASGAQTASYTIGTSLGGIDVSADGKYLVATELTAGPTTVTGTYTSTTDYYVHRLDLTTGVSTTYTQHSSGYASNFYDAAFLPDDTVLLTQNFNGSGFVPLTTLDFGTGTFIGSGSYAQDGALTAAPDKKHIAFLPANISDDPVYVYTAGNGITASQSSEGYNNGVQAISAAGDLIVQGSGLRVYDGSLHLQVSLSALYPQWTSNNVTGMAFSPAGDKLYLLDFNAQEVFALDTKTWAVLGGFPVGAAPSPVPQFYAGSYGGALSISADGHTLSVLAGTSVQLLDLTKLVNDSGTSGDDTIYATTASHYVYGFAGNDALHDGPGAAGYVMYGGTGDDSYYVSNAADQVIEAANQGFDTIYSSVSYTLPANVEKLVLTGTDAINATAPGYGAAAVTLVGNDAANVLTGGPGDDTLIGGGGNDTLNGGTGNDTMSGGTGDDTYYVDSPADVVIELPGEGYDTVYASVSYTLSANVEKLILTATGNLAGTGNALDNVIIGNGGDNVLTGGGGNDTIDGGAGFDTAVIASTAAQATISIDSKGVITVVSPDGTDTLTSIEQIRFTDGTLTTANLAPIQNLYQTYGGRDATSAELTFWAGQVDGGTTLTAIRTAILNDPLGQNHSHAAVTTLYTDYGGRAPTTGELSVWDGLIAKGADFGAVRSALLGDPLGATAAKVVGLYSDYAGRTPADAEVGYWIGQIKSGTALTQVRQAILDDAVGQAHTDATVTSLYQSYGGRAPYAAELTTWEGLIHNGATFGDVRFAILNDPLGETYSGTQINLAYLREFGRDATAGEKSTWLGLIKAGASPDTFLATLINDAGSNIGGTQRLTGTLSSDVFTANTGHDTVVSSFDPAHDTLKFGYGAFGSTYDPKLGYYTSSSPLDGNHARAVTALDGSSEVLFTMYDNHHVLLTHTALADLTTANVVVGS